MKRTAGYIALGLVAYLIFAATMLPAQKALGFAITRIQAQGISVAASGVTGSIWTGRASSLTVNGVGLQQVSWGLNPFSLLGGRLGGDWDLVWQGTRLQGHGSAAPDGRVLLQNVTGRSPAAKLATFLPIPVSLGGDVTLDLKELELEGGRLVAAEGSIAWTQAAFISPLEAALGDIRVVLKPRDEGGFDARMTDGGGPLQLDGQLQLETNGTYRLDALLGTRPGASPALEENLAMVGRRTPKGYRVVHQGSI